MNCWAAVCVDAAKASYSGFERDVRNERTKAAIAVKGDIISLLKHSSLYLLATSYGGALAKLVYLHRAMHSSAGEGIITLLMAFNVVKTVFIQFWLPCYVSAMMQADVLIVLLTESSHGPADIAHILGSDEEHMPASITIHSAADLLWTDGLDVVRHLVCSRDAKSPSKALGSSFELHSLRDIAWFCKWKGLSDSEDVNISAVQVVDLLAPLGIPKAHQQAVVEKLDEADVPLLQQVALGDFTSNIVDMIDCQLSGLGIRELYQQQQLFAYKKS